GAEILGGDRVGKKKTLAGGIGTLLYSIYVILWDQRFFVAILYYVPATLFLLVVFMVKSGRGTNGLYPHYGTIGSCITLAAAAIQHFKLGIHPLYFNHNALYHLLQAIALVFLYVAIRGLICGTSMQGKSS